MYVHALFPDNGGIRARIRCRRRQRRQRGRLLGLARFGNRNDRVNHLLRLGDEGEMGRVDGEGDGVGAELARHALLGKDRQAGVALGKDVGGRDAVVPRLVAARLGECTLARERLARAPVVALRLRKVVVEVVQPGRSDRVFGVDIVALCPGLAAGSPRAGRERDVR